MPFSAIRLLGFVILIAHDGVDDFLPARRRDKPFETSAPTHDTGVSSERAIRPGPGENRFSRRDGRAPRYLPDGLSTVQLGIVIDDFTWKYA